MTRLWIAMSAYVVLAVLGVSHWMDPYASPSGYSSVD